MEPLLMIDQEVLITIKRLGINGEGIGYYKKQAVFIDGVFPPEQVVVKITEVYKGYSKGETVRIKVKAAKRVKPFCKHFGECGGCQIQHIDYEEQLALKEEMIIQTFDRYTNLDVNTIKFNKIIGMKNNKHYRAKAQMPVKNTEYGITTGLYKKESNDLVPIADCPIHQNPLDVVPNALRKKFREDYGIKIDPLARPCPVCQFNLGDKYKDNWLSMPILITVMLRHAAL